MGYKKKTLKDFRADLESGRYESVTGARRAVGKFAEWSEADLKSAHKLINAHFGDEATKPVAKAAKSAKVAKGKKGRKAEAKPEPVAATKAPKAIEKPTRQKRAQAVKPVSEVSALSGQLDTFKEAIETLHTIKQIDQGFDVTAGLTEAHEGIRQCLARLRSISNETVEDIAQASNGKKKVSAPTLPQMPGIAGGGLPGFAPQS